MNTIKVKVVNDGKDGNPDLKATIPTYGSDKAAGFDLYSIQDVLLQKNMPTLVKTGLKMQVPDGTELQIRPRSGLALKDGITVLNTPGTIDEDYRGEIGVILFWTGADTTLNTFEKVYSDGVEIGIHIPAKTRIAQAVLAPVLHADFEIVDELDSTERGEGGFGHTGVQ